MKWIVFLALAVAALIGAGVLAVIKSKMKYVKGAFFTPSRILFIGVMLAAVFMFVPFYLEQLGETGGRGLMSLFMAGHMTMRLFAVDGEFEMIVEGLGAATEIVRTAYFALASILFVAAPVMTFGVVLSFFRNLWGYIKYVRSFFKDAYVFSEINERSLALAESLKTNDPKRLIVFTDVYVNDDEASTELYEDAMELGAICFKKDVLSVNFGFHSPKAEINFFTIGEDETENMNQAIGIVKEYAGYSNASLYVFTTNAESELMLINAYNGDTDSHKIKIRRINEAQSLVSRNLYDKGVDIFNHAVEQSDGTKNITAIVVGMGRHGEDMTKSLAWFCQMDGYKVEIHSFDRKKNADTVFAATCPELMAEGYNGKFDDIGEAQYKITVHPDIDVDTMQFIEEINAIPEATYVLVALGNDDLNISVAAKLRMLYERMGQHPMIQAIVYNSDKKDALGDICNYKGQKYDIDFIGDMRSSYSEDVVLDSDVEAAAFARHTKWGDEKSFWQYEYNYRSSVASAIHKKMKIACGMPGIELEPSERPEDQLWALRRLEHRRWNAYMRSTGYVHGEKRNDLAKTHHCLVTFDILSDPDKAKDDD